MWTLMILWSNGFMTEFINIESEERCQEINAELRQQIWQIELLNPAWACLPDGISR